MKAHQSFYIHLFKNYRYQGILYLKSANTYTHVSALLAKRQKRSMIWKDVANLFPEKNIVMNYFYLYMLVEYSWSEKNAGIWSIYLSRSDVYLLLVMVYAHTHAFSFILVHAHTHAFSFVLVHCTKLPWVLSELLNLSGNRVSLGVRVSVSIFF